MELKVNSGTGLTSCLSVRLNDAIEFMRHNKKLPDSIDSSEQFSIYRDSNGADVSSVLLGNYKPDNTLEYVDYNHGWQYGWYDMIRIEKLSALAKNICPVSELLEDKINNMISRIQDRTCVLYRGNDKALEIARTPYQAMVEMAEHCGEKSFLVQTDEEEFFNYFKERFPDSVYFEEIPRISKNPDSYVMPELGKRTEFAVNFLCALVAISQAKKILMNTGNTGIWTCLFRGHIKDVWQVHPQFAQWRKLDETI